MCAFATNTAKKRGGSLYVSGGATVTVVDSNLAFSASSATASSNIAQLGKDAYVDASATLFFVEGTSSPLDNLYFDVFANTGSVVMKGCKVSFFGK